MVKIEVFKSLMRIYD